MNTKTQTRPADLSQHGMWPGGESDKIRKAYDAQINATVPAPRSAR